jgi:DNA excision repair protein ERCC-3
VTAASNPLFVQSDRTVLVETASPRYEEARDVLSRFAELEKSPEHVHTYRLTPISLWNAAAAGHTPEEVIQGLHDLSKYAIPQNLLAEIRSTMGRYGRLLLTRESEQELRLTAADALLLTELLHQPKLRSLLGEPLGPRAVLVPSAQRGKLKQLLVHLGHPVDDRAGYTPGKPLPVGLRTTSRSGRPFGLREYQRAALAAYLALGSERGGSGVVVLPCGAGKTIVGLGALAELSRYTLILGTNITALHQWRDEILDKTTLEPEQIGEYSGERKEVRPVTLATYQILTHRRKKTDPFVHFGLFDQEDWGLILYDEVHLLPAPVFRAAAEVQARRRLGLTATLVREDGLEGDVFSLIGPKRFDVPWRVLEREGWIAEAVCHELRVPFASEDDRLRYAVSEGRDQFRFASENPEKTRIVQELVARHREDRVLVIGQYLDQLEGLAATLQAPLIQGSTPSARREELYTAFKTGRISLLIVSKVANFAVDLPDANVAIQVSGTFGSRQEEAQRLGRILRPKQGANQATFYSLISRDTVEQEYSARRQLFLTEQGYRYEIHDVG